VRRCARHLTESINFPLTKSQRVRKDEGKSGGEIAGKLGRMVVRNTQAMPLTSRPAASRAPLRSLPHLHSHFRLLKNFQKTWTDKARWMSELRGRLQDIALAFGCTFCFDKLGAGSVSFGLRAHLLQQAKHKCKGWQQKMPRRRWRRSARGARGQGSLPAQEGRDAAACKQARERVQGSQTSSGRAGMPAKKNSRHARLGGNTKHSPHAAHRMACC
jgi:hypothetical protein